MPFLGEQTQRPLSLRPPPSSGDDMLSSKQAAVSHENEKNRRFSAEGRNGGAAEVEWPITIAAAARFWAGRGAAEKKDAPARGEAAFRASEAAGKSEFEVPEVGLEPTRP